MNRFTIFDEHLVGVHIQKQNIKLNKHVYLGTSILDDSKTLMYDFHYNFMLKKVERENIYLLFTDTDSLTSPWRFFTRFNSYKNGFNSYKNGFNSYMILHDSVIIFKNKTPENIQFSYRKNAFISHFKNSRKIA